VPLSYRILMSFTTYARGLVTIIYISESIVKE